MASNLDLTGTCGKSVVIVFEGMVPRSDENAPPLVRVSSNIEMLFGQAVLYVFCLLNDFNISDFRHLPREEQELIQRQFAIKQLRYNTQNNRLLVNIPNVNGLVDHVEHQLTHHASGLAIKKGPG